MNFVSFTPYRIAGIRGFVAKTPMFRILKSKVRPTKPDLIHAAVEAVREGQLRPGDRFPTPGEIVEFTGATLVDSLEAVNTLLWERRIKQDLSGRLFVSKRHDEKVVGLPFCKS